MVFGYKMEIEKNAVSSINKELYTVREFFAFMAEEGMSWRDADDQCFNRWRDYQLENLESISESRVEVKIGVVFQFYQMLPLAWPLDEGGNFRPLFVGKSNARKGVYFPITSKTIKVDGVEREVWAGRRSVVGEALDFSVPDDASVQKVLEALRTPVRMDGTIFGSGNYDNVLASERNWAIGRSMSGGGLRAIEVERATLVSFTKTLRQEGILSALPQGAAIECVSELASDSTSQKLILEGLRAFEKRHRRSYMFYDIVGKGNKRRSAYFELGLVTDLLIYIWNVRPKIISLLSVRDNVNVKSDRLFLSLNARETIQGDRKYIFRAGFISDLLQAAFIRAKVEGSGHDLRKYYATKIAVKILAVNMEICGFQLTEAVLETVLDRVREALGHSKINTTVRHYLNMARIHYFKFQTALKRSVYGEIYAVLLDVQHEISDRKIDIISRLIQSVSKFSDDSEMLNIIEGMLEDPRMWPNGNPTPPTRPPANAAFKVVK
ncbi:hypothetical protein FB480_105196 [Agrobacterium vitis]|nr:hypothetical protein FB480_105196 [Agrobacterium vitis]